MNNEQGWLHFWSQSDAVIQSVAVLLLLMSIASWTVIVYKAWRLFRLRKAAGATSRFWEQADFDSAIATLRTGSAHANPFERIAQQGQLAARRHRDLQTRQPQLHDKLSITEWVTSSLRHSYEGSAAGLQQGLAILASVGSTSPFIGLFGTVWGIYHALMALGSAGQVGMDQVAGPIGEALVMTALGLAVAIPSVLGYNALVRGNQAILTQLDSFGHDLQVYLVIGPDVVDRAVAPSTGAGG